MMNPVKELELSSSSDDAADLPSTSGKSMRYAAAKQPSDKSDDEGMVGVYNIAAEEPSIPIPRGNLLPDKSSEGTQPSVEAKELKSDEEAKPGAEDSIKEAEQAQEESLDANQEGSAKLPVIVHGREQTFPMKLHMILSNPEYEDMIHWLPQGRSFRVVKPEELEKTVIPLFFRHTRYASFHRQINGWGFKRVVQGDELNSYYHEDFLRDEPQLCKKMKRTTTAASAKKKAARQEHNLANLTSTKNHQFMSNNTGNGMTDVESILLAHENRRLQEELAAIMESNRLRQQAQQSVASSLRLHPPQPQQPDRDQLLLSLMGARQGLLPPPRQDQPLLSLMHPPPALPRQEQSLLSLLQQHMPPPVLSRFMTSAPSGPFPGGVLNSNTSAFQGGRAAPYPPAVSSSAPPLQVQHAVQHLLRAQNPPQQHQVNLTPPPTGRNIGASPNDHRPWPGGNGGGFSYY